MYAAFECVHTLKLYYLTKKGSLLITCCLDKSVVLQDIKSLRIIGVVPEWYEI